MKNGPGNGTVKTASAKGVGSTKTRVGGTRHKNSHQAKRVQNGKK